MANTVNPELETQKTSKIPNKIVIVGGVAGGMSCAARARRLNENAELIVLEKGAHVSFANCGLPYYVGGEITEESALLVQTPASLKASLNLDVRPNHEVISLDATAQQVSVKTPAGVETINYDALVLAPGASAVIPQIEGINSKRVRTLRSVDDAIALRQKIDQGAKKAVVLGAGFIGLEAAEALNQQGLETSIVEYGPHVLGPLDDELAWWVSQEVSALGIQQHTGVSATSIRPGEDYDTVELSDGTKLQADLIVLATGVRPNTAIFADAGVATERGAIITDQHGRTNLKNIWAVGDATASIDPITGARRPVALAGPANRAGRLVADHIMQSQDARPIPQPLGTAVVRIGQLTAAMTGANRSTLEAANIDFTALHLHPNQHAGYFPGAKQIHLTVHMLNSDGTILGAQAVGEDGVEKRIDVLATAIRGGLKIQDLIDLDLSYAPPYGQAKDAVNLAGMVGENVLKGRLKLWDGRVLEEIMQTSLVLDVRSDQEVATGMVPGALHIPHVQLRERIQEVIDAAGAKPVKVMCASGVRSAIAHRILVQAGLDSASLSGGITTLRAQHQDKGTCARAHA